MAARAKATLGSLSWSCAISRSLLHSARVPGVSEMLAADHNVQRAYLHPQRYVVFVYLGYYGTRRGGTPEHTPDVCYPAQGWEIVSAMDRSVGGEASLDELQIQIAGEGQVRPRFQNEPILDVAARSQCRAQRPPDSVPLVAAAVEVDIPCVVALARVVKNRKVVARHVPKDPLFASVSRVVPYTINDVDGGGPRRYHYSPIQRLRRRRQAAHVAAREDQVALVRWSGARRGTRYDWRRGDAADQEP